MNNYLYSHQKIRLLRERRNYRQNTSLAAKEALANRLQRRTACKIQNGRQGAPKWQTGSGKVLTPKFLGAPLLNNSIDLAVDNGEQKMKKKCRKAE